MAFNDFFKVRTWGLKSSKTENITGKLQTLTWSGSYKDCCRELNFDVYMEALCDLGGTARLYHGANKLFSGHIFERERADTDKFVSCIAYDNGIYLKNSSTYLAVRKQTPEAITRQLCRQYGIPAGSIAATGVRLSRNFLGTSLYQIIQTMYTLASKQTGKKYQIRFSGNALDVVIKQKDANTLRLIPGNNLISCTSKDSVVEMVNSVAVYNDRNKRTATYRGNKNYVALYGLMEKAIRASSEDDPKKTARETLRDNGVQTTITAECIGNSKLITGNTVVVHEPITKTDGLFWILSDSHTRENGIYRTQVTLNFRNLMDKQDAGSVPDK